MRINSWFNNLSQKWKNLVFIIVPILLFIFMLFRIAEMHFFYQGWYDPVYAFLMNGLTFALGSTDIGHIDHPGTPLQLFCALIIKIMGLFRGTDDLAKDVLTNPESYIRVISVLLVTINCILIWFLGLISFKNLKNVNFAIVVQLFPLLSFELIKYLPIVACESVVTFSSLVIFLCIILYDGAKSKWLVVIIALFSAISVATKVSSAVILIVPFFFFEKIKPKIGYLLLSFLFIFLFISPVIDKIGDFVNFIKGIATHTGSYGTGKMELMDWKIYFHSIQKMLLKEFTFTLHLLVLLIGWIVIVKHRILGSLKRLYIAITLATVFQVLVVARHYSFHYLMPIFALVIPLHGYFWIRFFKQKIGTFSNRLITLIIIILVAGVFTSLVVKNKFEKGIITPVEKTSQAVSKLKGTYIILTENNNGGPFIEPALRFGYAYSTVNMRKRYAPVLTSIYSGNYLWNCHDGFTDWNGSYLPYELFSKKREYYVYAGSGSCKISSLQISEMIEKVGISDFVDLKKVFENEASGEVIVMVKADTALIRQYNQPKLVIEIGMEELSTNGEKFKSNHDDYTFGGVQQRSDRIARNGKSSLLLTPSNPYGLNISIPVSKGKRFKVEFWQRSSNQKQALVVASASKSDLFYRTSNKFDNRSGEWIRSQLALSLPVNYPEESINFYLWNPETDSVWVDDFRLMVFE